MWKLQTNMHHANYIQNMDRADREKTHQDHAHNDEKQPIRIQRRGIRNRCNNQDRAIQNMPIAMPIAMCLSKAFGAINRTPLWATLYNKDLTGGAVKRIRR